MGESVSVRFLSVLFIWCVCGMCAPGMAFTCSNVLRAVRPVENWWGGRGLRINLHISKGKRDEIQQMYFDPEEQKRQLILYWMSTDPLASWRRLITVLDWIGQSPVADGIRDFAEPLAAGTVENSVSYYFVRGERGFQRIFVFEHFQMCSNIHYPYLHLHVV